MGLSIRMKRKPPEEARPLALEVEHLPPTAQQADAAEEGLRILAAWLVRRHKRKVAEEKALTSGSKRCSLSGNVEASSDT